MVITLKGLTLKGKNRIREHGERWRIVEDGHFQGIPAFLVVSEKGTDKRWVNKENDTDFQVVVLAPAF